MQKGFTYHAASTGPDHDTEDVEQTNTPRNASPTAPASPMMPTKRLSRPTSHDNISEFRLIYGTKADEAVDAESPLHGLRHTFYRSILNTIEPLLITALYLFIVFEYFLRPPVNDIAPRYAIDARFIFFAWLILSIFILDWAKSALSGFESFALTRPSLKPSSTEQLLWHADRSWGSLSGWYKASVAVYKYVWEGLLLRKQAYAWKGPSRLWWYLAFSSILFYIAIPLSGLSMDPRTSLRPTNHPITILGPNQTTFDLRPPDSAILAVNGRWRQGNPTTPQGATVFYAPEGTANVSETYYEDVIQQVYQEDLTDQNLSSRPISIFSGPQVSERAEGMTWGLLTNLSCSSVRPYQDLKLLNVTSMNSWINGDINITDYEQQPIPEGLYGLGDASRAVSDGTKYGVSFRWFMAATGDLGDTGSGEYLNASSFPVGRSLELVMWQSYQGFSIPDEAFKNMSTNPLVVSSKSNHDNGTYLGYAIRCEIDSETGFANLKADTRTYSSFKAAPANRSTFNINPSSTELTEYEGMISIEAITFAAFTTATHGYLQALTCHPLGDVTPCDPWSGTNLATNAVPYFVAEDVFTSGLSLGHMQYPTITPARMKLGIHKLLGEAAIVMMGQGAGNWTGTLTGFEPANDLLPGSVPWQLVLAILLIWTVVTALPNFWTFAVGETGIKFDGMHIYQLGADHHRLAHGS